MQLPNEQVFFTDKQYSLLVKQTLEAEYVQHNNDKRKEIQKIREQTKINEDRYNRKQHDTY